MKPELVVFALAAALGVFCLWLAVVIGIMWATVVLAALGSPAIVCGVTGVWLVLHDPDGVLAHGRRR